MTSSSDSRRIHLMTGFAPSGRRVRAVCACGYATTPRIGEQRALDALQAEHGSSRPQCALCGRDYAGHSWQQLRDTDLRILTDPATGAQFLVCRELTQDCSDGAAQRQLHLDRAALESRGLPVPAPRLRLLPGGNR